MNKQFPRLLLVFVILLLTASAGCPGDGDDDSAADDNTAGDSNDDNDRHASGRSIGVSGSHELDRLVRADRNALDISVSRDDTHHAGGPDAPPKPSSFGSQR